VRVPLGDLVGSVEEEDLSSSVKTKTNFYELFDSVFVLERRR